MMHVRGPMIATALLLSGCGVFVTKQEHEARYAQGDEWWSIVKQIWTAGAPFDFDGQHYKLQGAEGSPAPYGSEAPIMMNAGTSACLSRKSSAASSCPVHRKGMALERASSRTRSMSASLNSRLRNRLRHSGDVSPINRSALKCWNLTQSAPAVTARSTRRNAFSTLPK